MDVFELTRALVDIESITDNEERAGQLPVRLPRRRWPRARRARGAHGGGAAGRFNVFAQWGERPVVTLSTHMDTVPPFFPSREDGEYLRGRGACDAKGIIASHDQGRRSAARGRRARISGCCSWWARSATAPGAYRAAATPRGSRYIINGEPTGNKLALGSKGALRYEVVAAGKMAHSAYPELGDSAIHKLIDALWRNASGFRCPWTRCWGRAR